MKRSISTAFISLFFAGIPLLSQSPPDGALEIEFTGVHNNKGQIAVGLNTSPEGWPREPEIELAWPKQDLQDGTLVVRIDRLAYGSYAISVLDDVDLDDEMKMFMGLPREGFGFSNNPPHKLSVPDFEECAVIIDQPVTRITIEMRYVAKRN